MPQFALSRGGRPCPARARLDPLLISALGICLSLQMSAEHPGPGFMRITGVELGFVRSTGPWLTLGAVLFLAAALGFGWSGLRDDSFGSEEISRWREEDCQPVASSRRMMAIIL